ncbi:MAG TPA: hypothetical protein VGQ12_18725 [Candidatus Angelobacter sp.]|jgi:hypothetical protein|nr:hypothetical protein [Candidatus Angelobacter sp.]
MDFTARLRIGTARRIPAVAIVISIPVSVVVPMPVVVLVPAAISVPIVIPVPVVISIAVLVMIVVAVGDTAKLAINIFNCTVTSREGIERCIGPASISVLTASTQDSVTHANVPASLGVSAGWQRAVLFANQVAVRVGDVSPTTVRGIQHRIMIPPAIVLAPRAQVISAHIDVFTTLLVSPSRIVVHGYSA